MTTIVVADDHHVVRQGIKSLLEEVTDFQVIGQAADGLEVVQLVERVQPDVLVLDLMMHGINGLEVTREVKKSSPRTAIVILSMYGNEAYVLEALRAGAQAYVLKESTSDELIHAVREVTAGRRYLGSTLSEHAIEAYMQKVEGSALEPYYTLTTREREVLHMVAQGCTNTDIAKRLYISRRTVETHRSNMMQKLGLHTQTDLIRYALQQGIIPAES
jgi:two-component system response regulator NreC